MYPSEGLKNSLNAIREISSEIYHQYIPIIDENTDISKFASPILEVPEVYNEFVNSLINRIVYTSFDIKMFNNPLQVLEGDKIPLGYAGQEVYTNPAKGRQFNVNDFAGLLQKYEADVKVQYLTLNMDVQYPVSVSRQTLKKAFVSWNDLETFIDSLSNSLYNGAYIDEYRFTKNIISGAYRDDKAIVEVVSGITDEDTAKDFITKARALYLNFQTPSSNYNSWAKVGGSGNPIVTWSNPEDIVFVVKNELRAYLDVNVLASAFNIDRTDLLGRIITVDNFDVYDDEGTKVFDGSKIVGMIADKSWFKIKKQDMFMETFYNPNNRSMQYYLNVIKMYAFSLFANGVIFATEAPSPSIQSLSYNNTPIVEVEAGATEGLEVITTPRTATTPTIVYTSSNEDVFTVEADEDDNKKCTITAGEQAGTAILTATAGNVSTTITINVVE